MHLRANYPGTKIKEVIQVFTSPELPSRSGFATELGSVGYSDSEGFHTVFLFDVPDDKLSDAADASRKRLVYMMSRVEGLAIEMHFGLPSAEAVPEAMGLVPA